MYSSQPSPAQVSQAIIALAGPDKESSSKAYELLKTIDGKDLSLLPLLVEAIRSPQNGDITVSCALAISRYGDKAQAHVDSLAALLIPECRLNAGESSAVIFALSKIQCAKSVEVFRELLKSNDPSILDSVAESFSRLGDLARSLIPELRELEKKGGIIGSTVGFNLQKLYAENTGLEFENLVQGRPEFTAVNLHFGASHYHPESHQIRELDMARQGLLHDEMFNFRYGTSAGLCRLRVGKDSDGQVAVLFSYDQRSSGVSIQIVIEHLASTTRLLFPDLPENVVWYEHWCPSSGIVQSMELKRVEFTYHSNFDYFSNPQWRSVEAPESLTTRYGFNLSEFDYHP